MRDLDTEKARLGGREQELARKLNHLETEGKKEQREKVRELEKKLESVLHSFEYQARESVAAVQDRVQAQKLSKDAERRIAKLRREFREQFDSTVVAHTTGSDEGDQHATAARGAERVRSATRCGCVRWAATPRCCAISTMTPSRSPSGR